MEWTRAFDDYTWITPGWPALAPGIALAVVVVLLGVSVFRIGAAGAGLPWVLVVVAPLTLFGVGACWALPDLLASAEAVPDDRWSALTLFLPEARDEAHLAALGVLGVAGTVLVWLAAPRRGPLPWIRGVVAALALGGPVLGLGHVVWLHRLGILPTLAAELPRRMHVGHRLVLPVGVQGILDAGAWATPDVTIAPTAAGPVPVPIEASRPGFVIRRDLSLEAGDDRAEPFIALARGNHWAFEPTTRWHSQYLWFVSAPGNEVGPRVTMTVKGEHDVGPLRTFDIETVEEEQRTTYTVYRWNGAAVYDDAEGEQHTFLARGEGEPDADGNVPCEVGGFEAAGCTCFVKPPGGPLALPGVARCAWTTGNAVSQGVSIFLAIVTVGLVIEDPDRQHYIEAVGSGTSP